MKLNTEPRAFSVNGLKVHNYGIGDIATFQQVARSSMYSDPRKACIQEYLCNAVDAMRARARLDPSFTVDMSRIVISLTGTELAIADAGTGISPEQMKNNFASYYGSSKRDSDDDIGWFGLGCKTAFADPNRDSFTVDTVYELGGERRREITYHFINELGLTAYAEVSNNSECEADLGTKIILPVDEADMDEYINAIIHT